MTRKWTTRAASSVRRQRPTADAVRAVTGSARTGHRSVLGGPVATQFVLGELGRLVITQRRLISASRTPQQLQRLELLSLMLVRSGSPGIAGTHHRRSARENPATADRRGSASRRPGRRVITPVTSAVHLIRFGLRLSGRRRPAASDARPAVWKNWSGAPCGTMDTPAARTLPARTIERVNGLLSAGPADSPASSGPRRTLRLLQTGDLEHRTGRLAVDALGQLPKRRRPAQQGSGRHRGTGVRVQQPPHHGVGDEDLRIDLDPSAVLVPQHEPLRDAIEPADRGQTVCPHPPLTQQAAQGQPARSRSRPWRPQHKEQQDGECRPQGATWPVDGADAGVHRQQQCEKQQRTADGGPCVPRPASVVRGRLPACGAVGDVLLTQGADDASSHVGMLGTRAGQGAYVDGPLT